MSRYKQPYSLYKRGKYYYYRTYTPDGKRTIAKTTGKTSKGAAQKYCDALYLGGTLAQSSMTFKQYAEHFFDDNAPYLRDRTKPLAKNTIRLHRTNMINHLLPMIGNYKIADINYTVLKTCRMQLLEKLSTNFVILIMSTFRTVMTTAYKDRVISHNPFDFLDGLEQKLDSMDAFTIDEIKWIYENINDDMFADCILLLALTGMRMSECIGVELEDIKKADGFYYIDLKRQFNRNEYKPLKRGCSRQCPIIPEIIDLIGFQKTRSANFYRAFKPLSVKFESPDRGRLAFHSFRHFFITNTIASGIPESKVNYYTGHKQNGINKIYVNYKPSDLIEFLEWQKKTMLKIKGSNQTD